MACGAVREQGHSEFGIFIYRILLEKHSAIGIFRECSVGEEGEAIMLTTKEAAERLGVSTRRVTELVRGGDLKGERFGRSWMVDEAAVEQRLSRQPRPGRPLMGERDERNLSRHTLMNREHPVIDFTYDRRTREVGELKAREGLAWRPLGIGRLDKEPNRYDLAAWIRARSIPDIRPHLSEELQRLGLGSAPELMFSSLGLSLSDQYWFKPLGTDISWRDVNFFENEYAHGVRGIGCLASAASGGRTPDASTDGMLAKSWVRESGADWLLKGGTGNENREPYNELLATKLLTRLLPKEGFVEYQLAERHGLTYSACKTMVDARTELISAQDVLCGFGVTEGHNIHQGYIRALEELGVEDVRGSIDRMIVVDHLMANFDRHERNFGLIRDAESLDYYRVAPLFDHGSGFYARATTKELQRGPYRWASRPFEEYPSQQLALVSDLSWFDPSLLDGFADEIAQVLGENPALDEELIEAVQRQTARQLRTVTDLAAERGFLVAGW